MNLTKFIKEGFNRWHFLCRSLLQTLGIKKDTKFASASGNGTGLNGRVCNGSKKENKSVNSNPHQNYTIVQLFEDELSHHQKEIYSVKLCPWILP